MSGERKRDARQKFLLGGLIVRAGLAEADRAFLLGGLTELAKLSPANGEYRRLKEIGETAFKGPPRDLETPAPEETSQWR